MVVAAETAVGVGLAALAATSVAVTSLGVRLGTDQGRATEALVVVLLSNLVIVLPASVLLRYPEFGLSLRAVGAFLGAGITGTLFGRVCYFTSISRIGSSRTEPIKATQPLHATAVAVVLLGEVVGPRHFVGILLVVVGVVAITWETAEESTADVGSVDGFLLALGAAFFFGLEAVWARLGFGEGVPVLVGLAVRIAAASVGFFLYLRLRGALPTLSSYEWTNLRWYLLAGVANTLFLAAYYAALKIVPVSVAVPIVQSSPLVVVCLSALFLPDRLERVSWTLVVGAGVIVAGAIVITLYA